MKSVRHRPRGLVREENGAVLVFVLSLLVVFAIIGAAWSEAMLIRRFDTELDLGKVRARQAATAGIQAAIGDIENSLAQGGYLEVPSGEKVYEFPIYDYGTERPTPQAPPVQNPAAKSSVTVQLSDESGKININHAPPNVLMAILKIDGERARLIRSSLPRPDSTDPADQSDRRWFGTVDDLVNRGFLSQQAYSQLDRNALTTFTVADPAAPSAYINLNSATRSAIEAALAVSPEVADKIIDARPLRNAEELIAVAAKDPSAFNFHPDPASGNPLPKEFSFTSRCFRIVSRAEVNEDRGDEVPKRLGAAQVEAVVIFPRDDAPRIMYWNESTLQAAPAPSAPAA
jgi:DNA uptake protein ComE-like DNA-binding protein